MAELLQPDWDRARHIIVGWQSAQRSSMRELAGRADLQPSVLSRFLKGDSLLEIGSALKLYGALQEGLDLQGRRAFLEATGLLPLAMSLSRDLSSMFADAQPARQALNTQYEAGTHLMAAAMDIRARWPAEAMRLFQAAEQEFGPASSQGAWAALLVASELMHLGDYDRAGPELARIQCAYEPVMDPVTRGELRAKQGWFHYYMGNWAEAARRFRQSMAIARETGSTYMGSDAQHFLGRTYFEWGKQCGQPEEAARLFCDAERHLEQARLTRGRADMAGDWAFDCLRLSQLWQQQGKVQEAAAMRDRSRALFDGALVTAYVDMDEARLALEEGQVRAPLLQAEDALRRWESVQYAKGIADCLQILGHLEASRDQPGRALERYAAAWCAFPFATSPGGRTVRADIHGLGSVLACREGEESYRRWTQHLRTLAQERRGSFSTLAHVAVDRSAAVEQVLGWLEACS